MQEDYSYLYTKRKEADLQYFYTPQSKKLLFYTGPSLLYIANIRNNMIIQVVDAH